MEDQIIEQGENRQENAQLAEAEALIQQREEIEKLRKENKDLNEAKKKYYDRLLNGTEVKAEIVQPKPTVEQLVKDLRQAQAQGKTDLEYMTIALELDDACIERDGLSCFLPKGRDVNPTTEEKEVASRFHAVMRECVDAADGDPDIFKMEMNRRITDPKTAARKRNN